MRTAALARQDEDRVMICQWCEEPIDSDRELPPHLAAIAMHRECAWRAACGSLAHLQRKCRCFVRGSEEGDPPGLTKREAAKAAWEFGMLALASDGFQQTPE